MSLSVLVSRFDFCDCKTSLFNGQHLSIETFKVSLEKQNGIAISYAIGDWDREYHAIGHRFNYPEEAVSFLFGGEWTVREFLKRLVELSKIKGGLWLDQLSISQTPSDIQTQLGNIPSIYETFEVVILLPDMYCECLKESVSRLKLRLDPDYRLKTTTSRLKHKIKLEASFLQSRRYDTSRFRLFSALAYPRAIALNAFGLWSDDTGKFEYELKNRDIDCANSFPISSYFSRFWPLQELISSTSIRIVWCGERPLSCSRTFYDFIAKKQRHDLNRTLSRKYQEYKHDPDMLDMMLGADIHQVRTQGTILITLKEDPVTFQQPENSKHNQFARFLLGEALTRSKQPNDSSPISDFMGILCMLGISLLAVTDAKDYVLSVWPRCGSYQVPDDWNSSTPSRLLEDAICQVEKKLHWAFLNTLPAGLFGPATASYRWRPSHYLDAAKITRASDIYGPCRHMVAVRLPYIGVVIKENTLQSRLKHAVFYDEQLRSSNTKEALTYLRGLGLSLDRPDSITLDARSWYAKKFARGQLPRPKESWPDIEFARYLFLQHALPESERFEWGNLPEIDHHAAVYDRVAELFNLKPSFCRTAGLRLVLTTKAPSSFGFMGPQYAGPAPIIDVPSQQTNSPPENLSVRISTSRTCLDYETVRNHKAEAKLSASARGIPLYSVVGVWLTIENKDDDAIGAELCPHNGMDAMLV